MTWRRVETLIQWLPPGSWWQRTENPAPARGPTTARLGGGAGGGVRVIDAATDPDKARTYFAGMAAGGH